MKNEPNLGQSSARQKFILQSNLKLSSEFMFSSKENDSKLTRGKNTVLIRITISI